MLGKQYIWCLILYLYAPSGSFCTTSFNNIAIWGWIAIMAIQFIQYLIIHQQNNAPASELCSILFNLFLFFIISTINYLPIIFYQEYFYLIYQLFVCLALKLNTTKSLFVYCLNILYIMYIYIYLYIYILVSSTSSSSRSCLYFLQSIQSWFEIG